MLPKPPGRYPTPRQLLVELSDLHSRLEALLPSPPPSTTDSSGAAALIVRAWFGGSLLTASLFDRPHWFNRMVVAGGGEVDADLSGGRLVGAGGPWPPIQVVRAGHLYAGGRVAEPSPELRHLARSMLVRDGGQLFRESPIL